MIYIGNAVSQKAGFANPASRRRKELDHYQQTNPVHSAKVYGSSFPIQSD
jgi:hypothetical protein